MKRALSVLLMTAAAGLAGGALAQGASPSSDDAFVQEAAGTNLMETELGKIAARVAEDPKVRAYGQMLATDHGRSQERLRGLAESAGIAVPTSMEPMQQQKVDELSRLSGREFDRAYLDAMLKGHQDAVEKFRLQAREGQTDIDRWAAETLPVLEMHLSQGKELADAAAVNAAVQRPSGPDETSVKTDVAAPPTSQR